jgi:uncharacterized protein (TIGR03437 family)
MAMASPDLAVSAAPASASTPGTVEVLIGAGDGSFAAPVSYPVGVAPATIVADKFTSGGNLDIVVLDSQSNITNKVWLLPGKGDGTFGAAVSTATGTISGYLSYADFNHDGALDLLIADQLSSSMVLMYGKGDGSFQAPQPYAASAQPVSLAIFPLQDGNTAVISSDNASGNLDLYFADTSGALAAVPIQTVGQQPVAIAAGDVNGDAKIDVAMVDGSSNSLYLFLSQGQGAFASPIAYSLPSTPGPLALADLNADGSADAIVATSGGLAVLMGSLAGTLGSAQMYATSFSLDSVTVGDFNKDGSPDVAAAAGSSGEVLVFPGNPDGTLGTANPISFGSGLVPLATAAADVNRDGKLDLIVALSPTDMTQPGSVAIAFGNGDGTFRTPSIVPLAFSLVQQGVGSATVTGLAVGDVNNDGNPDIALGVSGPNSNQLAILLGKGDGTLQAPVFTPTNTSPPQIVLADLNGDGNLDVILADCCGLSEASFLAGNGDGTFQGEAQFPSGPNPAGIAAADFLGDGKVDLAIAGQNQTLNTGTLLFFWDAFAGTPTGLDQATAVSAANPNTTALAPSSLATAYGSDLAQGSPGATSLPLPTTFGGTTVSLTDFAGTNWSEPLIYVSAGQVNFLVSAGVADGPAILTVQSGDGTISNADIQIAAVAPALFVLNSANLVAADALLVSADGTQTTEQIYAVSSSAVVANPINLGSASDTLYLTLYGTGLRAAGTSGVQVTVGGTNAPVQFAGAQGGFAGLDQVNVILPHSLAGSGNVALQLTAQGLAANPVNITIQ